MVTSPVHSQWSEADRVRLVLPPLTLGQHAFSRLRDSWVSWAFLTPEARDGYLTRTRRLQPGDWDAGQELWFIDFISPDARSFVAELRAGAFAGARGVARWARSFGTGHVVRIGKVSHV
jgi:cytolysin-activating lysine-acyltransferase